MSFYSSFFHTLLHIILHHVAIYTLLFSGIEEHLSSTFPYHCVPPHTIYCSWCAVFEWRETYNPLFTKHALRNFPFFYFAHFHLCCLHICVYSNTIYNYLYHDAECIYQLNFWLGQLINESLPWPFFW